MVKETEYYDILVVSPTATESEIKKAYYIKEMAKESCDKLEKELSFHISRMEGLEDTSLRSSMVKEMKRLKMAKDHVESLKELFRRLEEVDPENVISAQLGPLFLEAHGVLCSYKKDVGDGLSRSMWAPISKVMEILDPGKIGDMIKDLKPSKSPSSLPITMEMVGLVSAMLHWCYYRVEFVSKLQEKVAYLKVLLKLTANRCNEHESMKDLFAHVEDVAYSVVPICVLNVYCDMETDSDFSELMKRISPSRPEVRKIYLSALIALKSLPGGSKAQMKLKYLRVFVDAVKEDLWKSC